MEYRGYDGEWHHIINDNGVAYRLRHVWVAPRARETGFFIADIRQHYMRNGKPCSRRLAGCSPIYYELKNFVAKRLEWNDV